MNVEDTKCCGMGVLAGLEKKKYELLAALITARDEDKKGYVLSTITAGEKKEGYGKFLLANGFEEVKTFRNPNSGNTVSVYGIVLAKIKAKMPEEKCCDDCGEDYYEAKCPCCRLARKP